METERAEFSISELAREFDVTPRAIRFYEDQGLLAPRRAGQRRIYTPRDRTRLKLTLRGKRLGLTLAEIRRLLAPLIHIPTQTLRWAWSTWRRRHQYRAREAHYRRRERHP